MRKILFSIFTIALVAGMLQFINVVNAQPAYALDTIEVTVDLAPVQTGGGSDGSRGGGSVQAPPTMTRTTNCWGFAGWAKDSYPGDGYVMPCEIPFGTNTLATVIWLILTNNLHNNNGTIVYNCPPSYKGTSALQTRYTWNTDTGALISVTCLYPAEPVKPTWVATWRCATNWSSGLYQAGTKDAILNGGSMPQGASAPNGKSGSFGNSGNCPGGGYEIGGWNFPATDRYNINAPQDGGYGYYRMDLRANYKICGLWGFPSWTGNHSEDEYRCTGETGYVTGRNYAVSSCNHDYTKYGNNWNALPDNEDFRLDACVSFTCKVTGSTQINGTSTPVEVMRNGEPVKITYPTIEVLADPVAMTPAGTTWDIKGATGVVDGSTPFNSGVDANNAAQYFQLFNNFPAANKQSFLTSKTGPIGAWEPQTNTTDTLKFLWASNTGQSWKAYRTWKIDNAQFYIYTPGSTNGGNGSKTWQQQDVYCGYEPSNPVKVVRGANE